MAFESYCPTCSRRYPEETPVCPHDGSPLLRVPEEDLIGKTVDRRYRILEQIGEGGMGTVYRAVHQMLQREVAIKVVRRDVVQDETAVKRFLTEARAIAALRNPHTVTIYDSGVTEDGALYYTMELLTGRPLSHLLRTEGAVDARRAAALVAQVCDSLEEAHAMGILHRDIKPDNIFLVRRDGAEFAKLVDFGIAKVLGDNTDSPLTRTGMLVGTPRYLSPEQVGGDPVGPGADLYALAVVLYELLTGTPPFSGETPAEIMMAHVQDLPDPVLQRNPNGRIPETVDLFVRRALEKDPRKRFATAGAFRAALLDAVGSPLSGTGELVPPMGSDATLDALQTPLELQSQPTQTYRDDTPETVAVQPAEVVAMAWTSRRVVWWLLAAGLLVVAVPLAVKFWPGSEAGQAAPVSEPVTVEVAKPSAGPAADATKAPVADVSDMVGSDGLLDAGTVDGGEPVPALPDVVADMAPDQEVEQDVSTDGLSSLADLPRADEGEVVTGDVEAVPQPAQDNPPKPPEPRVQTVTRRKPPEAPPGPPEKPEEPKQPPRDDDWFDDVDRLPTN